MEKLFIPNEEYHASSGISNSALSELKKSPLHYWSKYLAPERPPSHETPAMRIGTAVHAAILEPHLFESEYVQAPKVDRRTKEGKAAWEALPEHAVKLSFDEWNQCVKMRESVRSTPVGKRLLSDGEAEASYYIEYDDILCKCRPDWVTDKVIVDVKTTDDASSSGFMRSAIKFGYHRQAAWYLDLLNEYGTPKEAFVFCVVEKTAPYAVAWYYATDEMIEAGRRECMELLNTFKHCLSTDRWPGYGDEIQPLKMPEWYK